MGVLEGKLEGEVELRGRWERRGKRKEKGRWVEAEVGGMGTVGSSKEGPCWRRGRGITAKKEGRSVTEEGVGKKDVKRKVDESEREGGRDERKEAYYKLVSVNDTGAQKKERIR